MTNEERAYLRDLAKRVADRARDPRETAKVKTYESLNQLRRVAPPVHMGLREHEIHKLLSPDSMRLSGTPWAGLEYDLRWRLCRADFLKDDYPVTDHLFSGLTYTLTDWTEKHKQVRIGHDNASSHFEPCLIEYDDFKKLRRPELSVDQKDTEERYQRLQDLAGDLMTVIRGVPFTFTCGWGESMIDELAEMRGLEQIYYDFMDAPEFIHEAMDWMSEAKLRLLDQYVEQNAVGYNHYANVLGSSGPGCLPVPPGPQPPSPRPENVWGFAQAQELSEVSPSMLAEFILPYQQRLLSKFALSVYGCCEAIENKIEVVSRFVPNLRMVSIGPFTNHKIAAPLCENRFVYAWKPHPACFIEFNEEAIVRDLAEALSITKNCCMTINMYDVLDYGGDLNRLSRWVELAKRTVQECEALA